MSVPSRTPCVSLWRLKMVIFGFPTERDWRQKSCYGNNSKGVICFFCDGHLWCQVLRTLLFVINISEPDGVAMGSPLGPVWPIFLCLISKKNGPWITVHVQPSGLEMSMTLSPCFTIRTLLFNSFLISIAGTRTFNSPLNLNRTKRFLFLMSSS